MSRRNRVAIAAILVLAFWTLFSACGGKQEKPEKPENSYVLKDLPEWVKMPEPANKYVESVDLHDEDSAGSEYWKVRVCSAEEQAKGNMFETDYFYFGEPQINQRYALKIKENVTLPKNLYLGWLYAQTSNDGAEISEGRCGYYVPKETFAGRTEIEYVSVPERDQTLTPGAFMNCIHLKKVYVRSWENWWQPQDPVNVGGVDTRSHQFPSRMFLNCVSLTEVIFGSVSIENPGGVAAFTETFMNCVSLKSISFPGFLERIQENGGDWKKTRVRIAGEDAFKNCINFGPADENQEIETFFQTEYIRFQ